MKYTIEGFSQEAAISLKKEIEVTDPKTKKTTKKTISLDMLDLSILRWFVDFYPKMKKYTENEKQYAWVSYESIINDLPLLGIEKRALYNRFSKMVELGILEHKHIKQGGSFSYYGFGEKYISLIEDNRSNAVSEGVCIQIPRGMYSNTEGVGIEIPNKDSSINNSSININIYDETFEKLWELLKPTSNDRKNKVTKKRKKELYEMGFGRTKKAIELYLKVQDPKFLHKRDNFLNDIIDNYLDKTERDFDFSNKTGLESEPSYDIKEYENYNILDYYNHIKSLVGEETSEDMNAEKISIEKEMFVCG